MTTSLGELLAYSNEYLQVSRFRDYCPNGLQVEGRARVQRLASGVTASQQLLDEAIAWGADAILVHHGYFWKGESAPLVGMKKRRLAALLRNDVSLLAYHLPLDAHPEVGNNACLGRLLGLAQSEPMDPVAPDAVGNVASFEEPRSAGQVVADLARITGRQPLHIGDPEQTVSRVAWCTGAAQSYIDQALAAGAELFITGEVSEPTVHTAREEGIQFVAAGHHATERFGVQALGEHLSGRFGIEHRYIEVDNPV